MKTLRILVSVLITLIGVNSASAQFMSGHQSTIFSSSEGYNSVVFGYSPTKLTNWEKEYNVRESGTNSTFSVGILHASPFETLPALYEIGGVLEYTRNSFERYNKYSLTFGGLKVPINILLPIQVQDNIQLLPFGGVNGRINCFGRFKYKSEDSFNLYDDDQDEDCKRITAGFQIGIRVLLNNIYFAIGYSSDFTPLIHIGGSEGFDAKYKMTIIGIGLCL